MAKAISFKLKKQYTKKDVESLAVAFLDAEKSLCGGLDSSRESLAAQDIDKIIGIINALKYTRLCMEDHLIKKNGGALSQSKYCPWELTEQAMIKRGLLEDPS